MSVFLTGGSGFIGRRLVDSLVRDGIQCLVVSRSGIDRWNSNLVTVLRGDPVQPGPWQRHVDGADVVINLAGAKIVDPPGRWTRKRKAVLRRSRIGTTRSLADAIRASKRPPRTFVSASAVGYYGPRGNEPVDEQEPPGNDFLASLAVEWEAAATSAADTARVVLLRTGLPLSPEGGVLAPMLPLFRLGLGGPWGDPAGWLSWIHIDDAIALMRFAIEGELTGPVNLTAPNPVTVGEFATGLGRALGRPAVLRAPAFALRLGLGESADALLNLQRVVPEKALAAGFVFRFPDFDGALDDLFTA